MKLGANLYSLKDLSKQSFDFYFEQLHNCGYQHVEPIILPQCDDNQYGIQPEIPLFIWRQKNLAQYVADLKENWNISIWNCHIGFSPYDNIVTKLDDIKEIADKTEIRTFTASAMFSNIEKCKQHMEQFSKAADIMQNLGLQLQYHNHSEEFTYSEEVQMTCIDYFLKNCSDSLKIQVDVGWVMFGDVDIISFLTRYKDQIRSLHLKDFKEGFTQQHREKDIVAVGTGILPLNEIFDAASTFDLPDDGIIIDQDCSPDDILADLCTGYKNVEKVVSK